MKQGSFKARRPPSGAKENGLFLAYIRIIIWKDRFFCTYYSDDKATPMKNLILILSQLFVQASAQDIKTISNTEVKEVKVFQNGAQINRTLKSQVDAGMTQLNIEGLSANIDKNSISVAGTGEVVLLSVTHQLNYLNSEKKTSEQVRLEDSLEFVQADQEKLNNLESVYNEEQSLLQANKSVGGANTGLTMENLQKVADFFRSRMLELKTKATDLHKDQKRLGEKMARIQRQLAELNAKRNQPTSTVTITVSAKDRSSVSLDLTYYVTGAGWTPQYDIRAKDINSPVQLAYKANVFQQTGESWDNVKLKLSTGNPSQGGAKPYLNPWYLDFYYPVTKRQYENIRGSRMDAESPAALQEVVIIEGKKAKTISNAGDYVTVNENQLSTDFDIPIRYSILPDGKMNTVDIQSHSMPAVYSYFAVPKLDKTAFLVARITGWAELNLLAGKANVYFEGTYVGESVIDPRSTNDTLDLSLGRDQKIIIIREKKKDLSSTKFIGSGIEKELTYLITVRNTKKDKISITLEDQLPLTKNNDINVKAGDISGGSLNAETGKITWNLEVAPSSSLEKRLNFSVRYPKDKTVSGL